MKINHDLMDIKKHIIKMSFFAYDKSRNFCTKYLTEVDLVHLGIFQVTNYNKRMYDNHSPRTYRVGVFIF